ncbi:MAG: DUF2442 domain-containing protein [Flavisolibacter sp.]|nr:DUF2442 domain-containing protein [Flavisolibacter sp.]
MGNGVHSSQKGKVRRHPQKNKQEISVVAARYVSDFSIAVTFSSGQMRVVNFLPLFAKYVKGTNLKYFTPERFKKFIVKNGNIYWGRNEDIIFPVALLYDDKTAEPDEILYII